MSHRPFVFIGIFAALASACAGEIDGGYGYDDPSADTGPPMSGPEGVVSIWLHDHRDLDVEVLYDACDIWAPAGFSCRSEEYDDADIRVYARDSACIDPDGDGKVVLATAYGDRTIVVESGCIARSYADEPDERAMRVLLAHEIGHVIGLPHVPLECDADGIRYDLSSGAPICGNAVMNPFLDPTYDFMTGADWLNFESRAVFSGPQFGSGDDVVCEFLRQPPSP